ncbi:MAG: hypothetical protein V3V00_02700 [Saprospiraceae bacterium]
MDSINRVNQWLQAHNYEGYDPFDGLNSNLSFLTFQIPFLRQVFIQAVKRLPLNIRPLIGISPQKSSKGIAYIIRGDLLLYKSTGDESYFVRAKNLLDWLERNHCNGYSGYCWGNHFDYQTRGYFLKKNNPTLVWTALTGRSFVEAFEITGLEKYLNIVDSTCNFIINDLPKVQEKDSLCISYIKNTINLVHNANLLGAAMLAQGYKLTHNDDYKNIAKMAVQYSLNHQREDGSWFYGQEKKYHWIDNWHTAYNLDALKIYEEYTGDTEYSSQIKKGLKFYVNNFFLPDGTPKYYFNSVYPIDIQCASQSIDTLVFFKKYNQNYVELAYKVSKWTIANFQDRDGHFYLWKNKYFTNKTPTLHWAQATMYHALANLFVNS